MASWVVVGAIALIAYAYAGYPLVCFVLSRLRPRPVRPRRWRPKVTVIVAARGEAARIAAKVSTVAAQSYPRDLLELVIACDGDPDTARAAHEAVAASDLRARVIELPRGGKPAALNAAVSVAHGEVLVFTDARQRLSADAVLRLVEALGDPAVGVVGGLLELEGGAPSGAYWRYEAWIRRAEAAFGSTVGVSGALYAIRKSLFRPLPPETILDDVLVPMRARLAGYRVALEPRAVAWDAAAETSREVRRKVRTLSGNLQLVALEPRLLSPWAPSFWSFLSHKLLRLAVPWALVALFVASFSVEEPWRALLVMGQLAGYGLAALRALGLLRRSKLAGLAETFVALNAAAAWGALRFLRRGRRLAWS